jgi:hypothetical protein
VVSAGHEYAAETRIVARGGASEAAIIADAAARLSRPTGEHHPVHSTRHLNMRLNADPWKVCRRCSDAGQRPLTPRAVSVQKTTAFFMRSPYGQRRSLPGALFALEVAELG